MVGNAFGACERARPEILDPLGRAVDLKQRGGERRSKADRVRSFAVAGGAGSAAGNGQRTPTLPPALLRSIGVLCFAVVVAAVLVGLTIIVATGLGQEVSFDHVFPTFTPKD